MCGTGNNGETGNYISRRAHELNLFSHLLDLELGARARGKQGTEGISKPSTRPSRKKEMKNFKKLESFLIGIISGVRDQECRQMHHLRIILHPK
jgi:hypothetical protein